MNINSSNTAVKESNLGGLSISSKNNGTAHSKSPGITKSAAHGNYNASFDDHEKSFVLQNAPSGGRSGKNTKA